MGDFNATPNNLGSQLANARGRQLQEFLNEGIIEGVDDDSPTFERNDYEVKLDWILASQPLISYITNVETHPTIGTLNGHKPLTYDMTPWNRTQTVVSKASLQLQSSKMVHLQNQVRPTAEDMEQHTSYRYNPRHRRICVIYY